MSADLFGLALHFSLSQEGGIELDVRFHIADNYELQPLSFPFDMMHMT